MAKTQDYIDYLNDQIDIAPASSQEELRAAQCLAYLFDAHGLEPTIQEFDVSSTSTLSMGILMVCMFVGALLAGVGSAGLTAVGVLLVLGAAILLIMRYLGNDVLGNYGPVARSQNVIAFHGATGELAMKGNRPIVIVAHYDTPREELFNHPVIAPYQTMLKQASVVCVPLVLALTLLQVVTPIPGAARRIMWLVAIIASLPLLLWGVSIIARRFMGCTPGANDNKAALAAMLSVLNHVRPIEGEDVPSSGRDLRKPVMPEPEPEFFEEDYEGFSDEDAGDSEFESFKVESDGEADVAAAAVAKAPSASAGAAHAVEVDTVRHGEETLASLGILPEDCEIVYEAEAGRVRAAKSATSIDNADFDVISESDNGVFFGEVIREDESEEGPDVLGAITGFFTNVGDAVSSFFRDRFAKDEDAEPEVFEPSAESEASFIVEEVEAEEDADSDAMDRTQIVEDLYVEETTGVDLQAEAEPIPEGEFTLNVGADGEVSFETADAEEAEAVGEVEVVEAEEVAETGAEIEDEAESEAETVVADVEAESEAEAAPEAEPEPAPDLIPIPEIVVEAEAAPEAEVVPEPEASTLEARAEVDLGATVVAPSLKSRVPEVDNTEAESELSSSGRSKASRRAILFDLPDPSERENNPFETTSEREALNAEASKDKPTSDSTVVMQPMSVRIDTDNTPQAPVQDEIGVITPEDVDAQPKRKRRGLFGRHRDKATTDNDSMSSWLGLDEGYDAKKSGRDIGSWDNFDDSDDKGGSHWKGGATENGRFRVIDGDAEPQEEEVVETAEATDDSFAAAVDAASEELAENFAAPREGAPEEATEEAATDEPEAPSAEDLRDAILSMGDDALISHDIWFVATGASDLNNAGIKAFLAEYRRACRGAFLINLDCIGSGQLTVLTNEGLDNRRRADRRLVRLLTETASDLHIDLAQIPMKWGDTDATPAMRTSMRSATLVGLDENGLPALSGVLDDVPEAIDEHQVDDVATLITEAIRRS